MTFHCVALHSKAGADQISDEPCLRLATLRFAFARPCSSKQRLRCPYQSIAVACRGFASPLPRIALLCVTVAVRCRSWPSYPMPLRIGSLPVLRGAVRFLAHPSPIAPMLCRRLPEQIKALPLQRPSPQRHRDARPSHANPLPPTSSRCRRISLKAALRCSVAPPRYAVQIHRHTTPLTALPSRTIATLR